MGEISVIPDNLIEIAIDRSGYRGFSVDECRLNLAELIIKAQAGYYNSYTEEEFMRQLKVLKKDRTPNLMGRRLLVEMFYRHSNKKCKAFDLIDRYRNAS